jgi:rhodanese-related sulfurtransferase
LHKKENAMKWLQFLTPAKSMDFKETQKMIDRSRAGEIVLLDVRQPNEYKQSHIPGATLIPLPELSNRLDEIDPEKPVLVY